MPTLDWLNRTDAFTTAARVPYRLLEPVSVHTASARTEPAPAQTERLEAAGASTGNGRTEIHDKLLIQGEKRQIGELWARQSKGVCLFGQVVFQRDGVNMSGQLDSLLK